MTANYRVLLSAASAPSAFFAEVPFTSISYTETLNETGSCSVELPLKTARPGVVEVLTESALDVAKVLLWVERDGVLLFGGIVWDVSGDVASNSLLIDAAGFHSYTRRRSILSTAQFAAVDQLTIARTLIDNMEAEAGSLGLIGTAETTLSGVTRDRDYFHWDMKNYGQAIDQLASVQDGFDFRYDVAYSAGVPTVEFVTQYPSLGRRINFILDLGSNIELLGFHRSGSAMANNVVANGVGEGPNRKSRTATDTGALTEYPLLDVVESFPDIKRKATLKTKADYRLARGGRVDQYTVRLAPDRVPTLGSYTVGDIITLRGEYGYLSIDDEEFRITQISPSVGSEGEVVDMSLTNLEVFDT